MSEIELKPCPFCGGATVALHPSDIARNGSEMPHNGSDAQYAHCDGCGAEGPQSFHAHEAIELWNRRSDCEARIRSAMVSTPPAAPVRVTDEMVAAYKAAYRQHTDACILGFIPPQTDGIIIEATRRGIAAALSASPSPVDSRDAERRADTCPRTGLPHAYWPQGNCQYCGALSPALLAAKEQQP